MRAQGSGLFLIALAVSACVESGSIFTVKEEGAMGGASASSGGSANEGTGGTNSPEPGPVGDESMVQSGDLHSCAVVDGRLYCWGDNRTGGLGLADFEARVAPERVGSLEGWIAVSVGDSFSCGLRAGTVWCFGSGSSGQLGAGEFTSSNVPVEVSLPGPVRQLDVDHSTACAVLEDDSLYCWGQNVEGQLAQGDPFSGPGVNSAIPLLVGSGTSWQLVEAGQGHTCGIQIDGSLWCWGRNTRGELGLGSNDPGQTRLPERVGTENDWTAVACGQNHTCGIRGGDLYCWGDNMHSQLGTTVDGFAVEPTLIDLSEVVQVTLDTFHTCAIHGGGDVACWGRNIEGQLGDGTLIEKMNPTLATLRGDWEQIDAGRFHTCGVRDGLILCTGDNAPGRLGTGDLRRRNVFSSTVTAP